MKATGLLFLLGLPALLSAQPISEKLSRAMARLEADSQLQHALIGFSVADATTGLPVYRHAAAAGLAPASTQKILTSIAAYEILGRDYRYTTEIGYSQQPQQPGTGYFVIHPSFDPSFGSARFSPTRPENIFREIAAAIPRLPGGKVNAQCRLAPGTDNTVTLPDGWVWQDIGNYYGAGTQPFNWQENQYDVVLASGPAVGSPVRLVATRPAFLQQQLSCLVTAAEQGSGDNSIVYIPYGPEGAVIRGTIPVNEPAFTVGAAVTDPLAVFSGELSRYLDAAGLLRENPSPANEREQSGYVYTALYRHDSPPLDSLTYWFLQKSINLYGEALLKTMALKKVLPTTTASGVSVVRDFWSGHGIEPSALHIIDGSGLSPQNRVTADALVKALLYASGRPWFASFYAALPLYNNMKMKSGSIGGARAFTGYQHAASGKAYCFSIIVNNFDGSAATLRNKIFALLDNLK